MNRSKIIYWGLVVGISVILVFGIWVSFFANRLLERRGKLVEARLGKKAVAFFISTLRVLGLTVSLLALYLLVNLIRLFPCAINS